MIAQFNMGIALLGMGDFQQARRIYDRVATASSDLRYYTPLKAVLGSCAHLKETVGACERCVTLFGAFAGVFAPLEIATAGTNATAADALMAKCRGELGDAVTDAAWSRGSAMSVEEAVAFALAGTTPAGL